MTETIFLTRRNLQTLLNKLDRKASGEETACTIIKLQGMVEDFKQTMEACNVVAVEDEAYYSSQQRTPGIVHQKDTP